MIRQSNFELLRILCMLGILTGHVLIALYQDQIHSADFSAVNQSRSFLLNACAVGMNCFVMISGFFFVHLTKAKLLKFIGQCWWYGALAFLLFGGSWITFVFPVSESGLRFINSYLVLMLISPLINAGLRVLNGNDLKKAVALMLLCDIYLGYGHQQMVISADDQSLFHFLSMYCLGHLVAREDWKLTHSCWWCLCCFVLMTVLHAVKMLWFPIAVIYSLHHNSPMLVIASLLVFLWAKELKVPQSCLINWVAASVFSVYLIHCNPTIAPHFWELMEQVRSFSTSPVLTTFALIIAIIVFFAGSVLIDKVRIWVFDKIERKL